MEQLLSAPAVQFKGSGWYVTDYAKKAGSSPGAKAESADGKADATKDSVKNDSKAKSDSTPKSPEKK